MSPDLRALLRILRRLEPTHLPVRVRCVPGLDVYGYTWLAKGKDGARYFRVDLRECAEREMRDSLLHEWAHALTWQDGVGVREHCAGFQTTFQRLKSLYMDKRRARRAMNRRGAA